MKARLARPIFAALSLAAVAALGTPAAAAGTVIFNPGGFVPGALAPNGSAGVDNGVFELAGGPDGRGSGWSGRPVDTRRWTADFLFRIEPGAPGFTFTFQGNGTSALGQDGPGLGYQGIPKSVAVVFDAGNNNGIRVVKNGADPTGTGGNLPTTTLNLDDGSVFWVGVTFDDKDDKLTARITNTKTGAAAARTFTVDIPGTVESDVAFVGFTGTSSASGAKADLLTFNYTELGGTMGPSRGYSATQLSFDAQDVNKLNDGRIQIVGFTPGTNGQDVPTYVVFQPGQTLQSIRLQDQAPGRFLDSDSDGNMVGFKLNLNGRALGLYVAKDGKASTVSLGSDGDTVLPAVDRGKAAGNFIKNALGQGLVYSPASGAQPLQVAGNPASIRVEDINANGDVLITFVENIGGVHFLVVVFKDGTTRRYLIPEGFTSISASRFVEAKPIAVDGNKRLIAVGGGVRTIGSTSTTQPFGFFDDGTAIPVILPEGVVSGYFEDVDINGIAIFIGMGVNGQRVVLKYNFITRTWSDVNSEITPATGVNRMTGAAASASGVLITTTLQGVDYVLVENAATNSDTTIQGTNGPDTMTFTAGKDSDTVIATVNGASREVKVTGQLIIKALGGTDTINIDPSVKRAVVVDGGDGSDNITGGSGPDVLVGGGGNDVVNGGRGNDLVVGGSGSDQLNGNEDHDIVIGGNTTADAAGLGAVGQKWAASNGSAAGVTQARSSLNKTTIQDDGAPDSMTGGEGRDWFLRSGKPGTGDNVTDFTPSSDILDTLD